MGDIIIMNKARIYTLLTLFIFLAYFYPIINAFEIYIETGNISETEYKEAKKFIKKVIDTQNINLQDSEGNNCITLAVKCAVKMPYLNKESTGNAVRNEDLDTLEQLIIAGGDINWINKNKWTPLQYAVITQKYEIVKLLLKKGAKTQTVGHRSLLTIATETGNVEMAKLLLKHGVKATDKDDFSLLRAALNHDLSMIELLIRAGADPYKIKLHGRNAFDAANIRHKLTLSSLKMAYPPNLKTTHINNIRFENTNLKVALEILLGRLKNYKIKFQNDIPFNDYQYSGEIENMTVDAAITEILKKYNLKYKISNKVLIIRKRKKGKGGKL